MGWGPVVKKKGLKEDKIKLLRFKVLTAVVMKRSLFCDIMLHRSRPYITGCGGPKGCEMSRLPHFSRRLAHRWWRGCQPLPPRKIPVKG
jgi:hypothetical protein